MANPTILHRGEGVSSMNATFGFGQSAIKDRSSSRNSGRFRLKRKTVEEDTSEFHRTSTTVMSNAHRSGIENREVCRLCDSQATSAVIVRLQTSRTSSRFRIGRIKK